LARRRPPLPVYARNGRACIVCRQVKPALISSERFLKRQRVRFVLCVECDAEPSRLWRFWAERVKE
jgi:hypothetical protein